MKNNRNVRKLFYTIFLAFLLCFGVGYASLNSSLFIDGVAIVNPSVLKVEFQNIDVTSSSGYAMEPLIEGNNVSGNLVFSTTGEFYEFTFDAVNTGTIDAMIDNFNVTPNVSGEMANYIKYEVSYENGEAISLKQVVNADSFVRFKVRIEYIGPNSDYDYYVGFSLNINYVESDGTGLNVKDNGVVKYSPVLVSGSLDAVGSEVCIKDECFYIISNNGTTVSMLSKYNLYVGGVYDGSSWEAYGDEATGKQHPEMLGYIGGSTLRKGTTKFSDTNYWSGTVSEYPSYVFNDKSIMYNYLNNYKKYLSSLKTTINNVRLITVEELINFGCDTITASCTNAPNFIYSTSYWSGSAGDSVSIWRISSTKNLDDRNYGDPFGVRPVVEVPVSEIIVTQKPYANGSLDEIGTVVTIGKEQFYVIGTEGNNVKLLSMYNLYVGNSIDENGNVTPLENPTGKQSELAIGYHEDYFEDELFPNIGTVDFSSDTQKGEYYNDYSGSIVEKYVNQYSNILKSYGIEIVEARLITDEELTNSKIGCDTDMLSCEDAPGFIHSTSYWTMTDVGTTEIRAVFYGGLYGYTEYCDSYIGVRPVIVIPKNTVVIESKPITNGSLDKIGTRVIIGGTEQFYVIGSDEENVKLLSMWNVTLGDNPKQSSLAAKTYFGSTDSTYIGSYAETYVLNYKKKLVNNGLTVKDARLITYDEISDSETFGCDYSCNNTYPWVYAIDFWTSTPEDTLFVWEMSEESISGSNIRYVKSGIRPVIIIPKNIIKMI